MITPFQSIFAVPLSCESCIKDVSGSLYKLDGIHKVEANLKDQLVFIEGIAAPSSIVAAIQSTGRDAILRGSGASNSAAVCILETHSNTVTDKVRGLARMVQVSPTMTIIDLTIRGLSPGTYHASLRETGDISRGAASTGNVWSDLLASSSEGRQSPSLSMKKGVLGTIEVNKAGVGTAFMDRPLQIWEMIGRSMVLSKQAPREEGGQKEKFETEDPDTLVGVIARSAGVWDNDKTVCSCSGKTVWEEREEQVGRGML